MERAPASHASRAAGPASRAPAPAPPARFELRWTPSDADLDEVCRLAGEAPLLSPPVLRALAPPGARLLVARVWRGDRLAAAAAGWERGLPFQRTLTLPALPAFADRADDVAACLWSGLADLARARRAPWVELSGLHGAPGAVPASLGALASLRWRQELLLDLTTWRGDAPPAAWREQLAEAEAGAGGGGLSLDLSRDAAALAAHHALLALGADSPEPLGPSPPPLLAAAQARLVQAGAAAVARARRGDQVLASLLLLHLDGAPRAAVLGVAAAPGQDGLAAATSLLWRTAGRLASAGARELSLGGVTETAPVEALRLRRPLATSERRAMHLVVVAGPRLPARLATAWGIGRRSPARLAAIALGRVVRRERFLVHAWGRSEWQAPSPPPGVEIRRLSDREVVTFSAGSDALATHRAYVQSHGFNAAWGLFLDGELAHVSWVLTRAHHLRLPFASLRLADDEVELGNCVTLPRFKGRGLYPHMIRVLSGQAFDAGVRRVLMVTARGNAASARGIEKAGLARCGRAEVLWLPPLRRARIRREVPGMAPAVEWVDLDRAFRARADSERMRPPPIPPARHP